jgi:hypothetical protein
LDWDQGHFIDFQISDETKGQVHHI